MVILISKLILVIVIYLFFCLAIFNLDIELKNKNENKRFQNSTNSFLMLPTISFGITLITLNLTVLLNGLC